MHFTRESIFIGAIRSFCTAFAALLGILLALVITFFALGSTGDSQLFPPKATPMITADAAGNRTLLPLSAPAILRLDIHGVIGADDLTFTAFNNLLLDSREGLLAHDRVKAVLLHIDSPGGTVTDSTAIYHALLNYKTKYKVPIYAFVDGLCASGAMYIACACDKIFATSPSMIGSVGVLLGPTFNFSQAMEKWGIQSLTLTQGKDKDMLNPFRPWVPGEDASLQTIVASSYQEFVDIVTKARPRLSKQNLIDEYGAQVFDGHKAQELGYIDEGHSSYEDALTALSVSAGIEKDQHYQVLQLNSPHNFITDLVQNKSSLLQGKIMHTLQLSPNLPAEFGGKLLYLYLPVQ
ncbi:MAG: S49 family peptidase [Simkania sp.]|nr:S49 family peptidase [Simkania sp.]